MTESDSSTPSAARRNETSEVSSRDREHLKEEQPPVSPRKPTSPQARQMMQAFWRRYRAVQSQEMLSTAGPRNRRTATRNTPNSAPAATGTTTPARRSTAPGERAAATAAHS
jgi:hypothetical protein